MSQEIQPFSNTPAPADFWTGQNGPSIAPVAAKMSPLKKMHRLLRGRYPLALFLATGAAIAGALGGYMLVPAKFESTALIQVNPVVLEPTINSSTIPMSGYWIASQAALVESNGVAEEALNNRNFIEAWHRSYPGTPLPAATDFINSVDAEHIKLSFVLKVTFDDKKKEVAEAGAQATVLAYMHLYGNSTDDDRQKKLRLLNEQVGEISQKLDSKQTKLAVLSKDAGSSDLLVIDQAEQEELVRLEQALDQAKTMYDEAVSAGPSGTSNKNIDQEFKYQQIATVDQPMRSLLGEREALKLDFEKIQLSYLSGHPQYQHAKAMVDEKQREIADYADAFMNRNKLNPNILALGDQGNSATIKVLAARVDALQKQVDVQRGKTSEVGVQRASIEATKNEIDQLAKSRDHANALIEELTSEQKLSENIKVEDPGSEAVIASDKRKIAAGVGFVFGGMLPIGLMLLYGMVDHRMRYSDETGEGADLAGVTLLGILPNLPDRLSDPQQAGIAAHCVHQIRTMLQINRNNDEPQVLAITSAAPGDGKTSLTLALGLSYAACGARTLLIDCDLVAAGLTHRLNVNAPEGVLESVANRALLEYVRTTDITDVAILPVGTTHSHHASTLSPVALRRLLSEAKKNFDIILIDTGPILGSIEASLVCAAADRSILAVARGQQRVLVERSIGHLQAIGADIAGVVFNRAQAKDFENSLSGVALRSRAITANGAAVSGSFKRAG